MPPYSALLLLEMYTNLPIARVNQQLQCIKVTIYQGYKVTMIRYITVTIYAQNESVDKLINQLYIQSERILYTPDYIDISCL